MAIDGSENILYVTHPSFLRENWKHFIFSVAFLAITFFYVLINLGDPAQPNIANLFVTLILIGLGIICVANWAFRTFKQKLRLMDLTSEKRRELEKIIKAERRRMTVRMRMTVDTIKRNIANWALGASTIIVAIPHFFVATNLLNVSSNNPGLRSYTLLFCLIITIVSFGLYFVLLVLWRAAHVYTLTDKRVIVKEGIISQTQDSLFLNKLENFQLIIDILDRVFRTGTFILSTDEIAAFIKTAEIQTIESLKQAHEGFFEAGEPPHLNGVPNPKQFDQLLRDAMENARE